MRSIITFLEINKRYSTLYKKVLLLYLFSSILIGFVFTASALLLSSELLFLGILSFITIPTLPLWPISLEAAKQTAQIPRDVFRLAVSFHCIYLILNTAVTVLAYFLLFLLFH